MKSSNEFADQFMTKLSNNVFDEEIKRKMKKIRDSINLLSSIKIN